MFWLGESGDCRVLSAAGRERRGRVGRRGRAGCCVEFRRLWGTGGRAGAWRAVRRDLAGLRARIASASAAAGAGVGEQAQRLKRAWGIAARVGQGLRRGPRPGERVGVAGRSNAARDGDTD